MNKSIWKEIIERIYVWRLGIIFTSLIVIARLGGLLQFLEWTTIDNFQRLLPTEPIDERIVIVGINDKDIKKIGKYPIPDKDIAQLINELQAYQPAIIGLDVYRDIPVPPGHEQLVDVFKNTKNLIVVEKALPPKVDPPKELPPEQVGFSDVPVDDDGKVRRSLLGTYKVNSEDYVRSLAFLLAEGYLKSKRIEGNWVNSGTYKFAEKELPALSINTGTYIKEPYGLQVLLNFRNSLILPSADQKRFSPERFRSVSLHDIKNRSVDSNWLKGKIVIIGMTAASTKDFVSTNVVTNLQPSGLMFGVEFHAHATSQIISAVLDRRLLLHIWPDEWEYLWIFIWGFFGIFLGHLTKSSVKNLLGIIISSFSLIGIGYASILIWGVWVPVIPTLLILLVLNGVSYTIYYQNERTLKLQIEYRQRIINERQMTIDDTRTLIHNGPEQTLLIILRNLESNRWQRDQLISELKKTKYELADICSFLKEKPLNEDNDNYIIKIDKLKLNLTLPIHQLFDEVFRQTFKRSFPHFETIKAKIVKFEPIKSQYLDIEQKKKLCEFIEEALCNVGKYAEGATRIVATGAEKEGWYTLKIQDNGPGICSERKGRGTTQFKNLEKTLGGKFKRISISPKGTLCEISWSLEGKKWKYRKFLCKLKSMTRRFLKF
ncbi:MAG: CHASE2 domain-containing protein [Cyanobacteria bacterium P01_A01_bin.68]